MKHYCNKRAEALTAAVLIVVGILVFLGWLISFNSKECRSNSQCQYGYYCGSDFSCHEMPVIERTLAENSLLLPSIVIGIAIVAAALIIKSAKNSQKKNNLPAHDHTSSAHEKKSQLKVP